MEESLLITRCCCKSVQPTATLVSACHVPTTHVPFIGPVFSLLQCQQSPDMAQSRAMSFGTTDMHGADLLWDASEPLFERFNRYGNGQCHSRGFVPVQGAEGSPQ